MLGDGGDGGCPCVSMSLHEAHACLDFKEGVGDVGRTSLLFYSYVKAALLVIGSPDFRGFSSSQDGPNWARKSEPLKRKREGK